MKGWTAVVPVKPWRLSKTRLDIEARHELARAFCLDVLDAVAGSRGINQVLVVTSEGSVVPHARRLGMDVIHDRPLLSRGGQ